MFTVCPKCALTLVVTAADLRVAQGYVRCGRCSSVFNALAQLSDERQASGSGSSPAAAPPRPPEPRPA
ncbi:MAG: MJ0042-type zinc finger domain-containing protein, partial [Steroidobacteraceae bacterium]